jgi:tetratricopeptide (TPR) repeat protein
MKITSYEKATRAAVAFAALLLFCACGQKDESATKPAAAKSDAAVTTEVPITTSSAEARELYLEGRGLLDDLHFVDAHDKFVQAVEKDPNFAMGHLMTAITSLNVEEFFDSVSKASAAAAGTSEGEQLYIQALLAGSENNQAAQLDALKKVVATYPKDPRTHMFLGNFLNGQQDFAGAAEHFTHATQLNPQYAAAYNSLGYAYRSLDDLDKAKAAFEKYVELLPNEANPQDSYAELLMEMGNYGESIEHYRMAIDIDPNFSSAYAGISRNYSLMGEPDRAQEAADQMLAASRVFAERQNALFQSATSHLFAGDVDVAMKVCNTMAAEAEVQRDHGAAAGAYEYMGDVMLNLDDAAQAEKHFAAALEHWQQANINEANKAQAQRTYTFKTAIAAMIAEDTEAAAARTAEYTAAVEASGTAFERRRIHALAGYLAMTNDDMAGGAEHLAQASQFNPVVLYWSAVAQNAIGNKDKAKELAYRAANRNTLSPNLPFVRAKAMSLIEELNAG